MFVCPLYIYTPPYVRMPPGVYTPPMSPYSSVHLFWRLCMLWGCNGLPFVLGHLLTPPLFGDASLQLHLPHSVVGSLCISVSGISILCGHFFSIEGFGGVPSSVGGLGESALEMSICSFLYIFCNALCLTLRVWL